MQITPSIWTVWIIIGVIAGYMTGRLLSRNLGTMLSVAIGIGGSLLGGWLTTQWLGTDDRDIYISMIVAAAGSAILLGFSSLFGKADRDND